jgi:hypothetical protein
MSYCYFVIPIILGGDGIRPPLVNSNAPLSHTPSAPLVFPFISVLYGEGKAFPAVVAEIK